MASAGRRIHTIRMSFQAPPTDPGPGDAGRAQLVAVIDLLEAKDAEAKALAHALFTLTEPIARQVMYVVDRWCDLAEDPRDPRQPNARRLLEGWVATMRRAEAIASNLTVVRAEQMPLPPEP